MAKVKRKSSKLPWIFRNDAPHARRVNNNQSFYNSAKWRKLSRVMRQQCPVCPVCTSIEKSQLSKVTDHIIPIVQGGAKYDSRNLMPMCSEHHDTKSGIERHTPIIVDFILNEDGDKIPKDKNQIIKKLNNVKEEKR